jgi:hypothetical protein
MGWASAGEIFSDVAWALIEADADADLMDKVLYRLADSLTEQDWDTVDESIDEFAGHRVVQHALRKANGMQYLYGPEDRVQGYIQFTGDAGGGIWELDLDGERITGAGTIAGFNALIGRWADRCGEYSGEVRQRYMLV